MLSLFFFFCIATSPTSRKQRPELWWNQGCSKALHQLLIEKLHVVGIVAIVIAFFQVNISLQQSLNSKWFLLLMLFLQFLISVSHIFYSLSSSFRRIFQLFGLIISMLLFCTIKHKRKTDTYKSYSPTGDSSATRQAYYDD